MPPVMDNSSQDSNRSLYRRVSETSAWLEERIEQQPEIALILGSGLGALAGELEDDVTFAYEDIPHFPVSAVEGHAGELVVGDLEGRRVVAMNGRVHYYEGWTLDEVTFPVRVFGMLELDQLLVTNSAGGAHPAFDPGDLMVISDHLNLTGDNPLRGDNDERLGPRFPDMTDAYDSEWREIIHRVGDELGIELEEGVYAGMMGPSYETPAEIQMVQTLGGDAVGMSTVPEVIVANHMGLRVAGISCITNLAAGQGDEALDHAEVEEVANRIRETFIELVRGVVAESP